MSSDSGTDVTVQSVNDPGAADAQTQAFVDATVAFMKTHEADINVALLARYFCLIGLVLLVYDNLSTLPTERRLIWTARRSFTKWGFLFNRYLVPVCLLLVFLPLSGFVGMTFSNTACQSITSITAMIAVASLALGNGLIVIRVVDLWDNHKMVTRTMVAAFIVTYTITLASFVVALFKLYAFIEWNPVLNMCVLTKTTPWLIPPWAAPLVFELAVLGATVWNVIDKPRAGNVSLKHALQRDGIIFFLVMTILRAINLGIVSSQHASTVMLGVFLIWSLVTLALNRSLLSFAKAELEDAMRAPSRSGRRSPFGIRASTHLDGDRDDKMVDWEAGEIEVGHVEIVEMR